MLHEYGATNNTQSKKLSYVLVTQFSHIKEKEIKSSKNEFQYHSLFLVHTSSLLGNIELFDLIDKKAEFVVQVTFVSKKESEIRSSGIYITL